MMRVPEFALVQTCTLKRTEISNCFIPQQIKKDYQTLFNYPNHTNVWMCHGFYSRDLSTIKVFTECCSLLRFTIEYLAFCECMLFPQLLLLIFVFVLEFRHLFILNGITTEVPHPAKIKRKRNVRDAKIKIYDCHLKSSYAFYLNNSHARHIALFLRQSLKCPLYHVLFLYHLIKVDECL